MIPVVSKNRGPSNVRIEVVEDDQPRLSVLGYRKRVAHKAVRKACALAFCMFLMGATFGTALALLVVRVVQGQQNNTSSECWLALLMFAATLANIAFSLALEKIVYEAVFRRKV